MSLLHVILPTHSQIPQTNIKTAKISDVTEEVTLMINKSSFTPLSYLPLPLFTLELKHGVLPFYQDWKWYTKSRDIKRCEYGYGIYVDSWSLLQFLISSILCTRVFPACSFVS